MKTPKNSPKTSKDKSIYNHVLKFYESSPYPLQKVVDSKSLLVKKHNKIMNTILRCANISKSNLKNMNILDAGCGTGEKSAWLALHGANVDAFDFCNRSLNIAKSNAKKLNLYINYFHQDFESFIPSKKYDLIIAIGCLHHTCSPKENFLKLSKALCKNAKIVVGLYSKYVRVRIRTLRKALSLLSKLGIKTSSLIHTNINQTDTQRKSLIFDRYLCPHESYHDVTEVLDWFKIANLCAISFHPKINFNSKLFDSEIRIILSQLTWFVKSKGFFFAGAKTQDF
jgi:2-polyprenyl-3-methyl-5-hydroxy-6-metoxy-1,4-benzoquinol methylase